MLFRSALQRHPVLAQTEAERQGAQFQREAAEWQRYPSVSAEFTPGTTGSGGRVRRVDQPLWSGGRISGQIDRLAVTDDAVLIADFKTNRPPPASVEDTPALYRTQMALYRAALQRIYPGKRIDCALVWTDGARLMPLPAALLDAEIAKIAACGAAQDLGRPPP